MEQSSDIGELVKAMAKAQAEMQAAVKDSSNPFFKSKYADYSSVRDASFPALNKNGLVVIQTTAPVENGSIDIITTLAHESGQWIKGILTLKPQKNDPQGIGSAVTYGRRYGLAAITGVAQEDDDAEAAINRNGNHQRQNSRNQSQAQQAPPPAKTLSQLFANYKCDANQQAAIREFFNRRMAETDIPENRWEATLVSKFDSVYKQFIDMQPEAKK
jgi:hypothetical protein